MDIHRCRFVPFPTSPVNAVAFSHSNLNNGPKSQKGVQVRLALGRANGDLEIWNPANGIWHQELVIPGGTDRSIDGLVWVTGPDEAMADGKVIYGKSRLFSIGYTTTVTEWDLEKARAKTHASGQHGDIWCLGAQPLPSNQSDGAATQRLVAGTVDGCLALYSLEDDELRFQRIIAKSSKKKAKMISIAFQSRHVAIVGCSDSTIRAYDLRNGTLLRQMTLGRDLTGGSKEIIVWTVKCLPNGDIVSGDSTGQVCIWDGKTYTQAQRIESHKQDVLSLAVSADGSKIVSGGMDRRTVLYGPMAGSHSRWSKIWHRRYHGHDVKTMASFEGKGLSVVVSGGPDATPVVMPLRAAGREDHRTLSHLPQAVPLKSAAQARLIASWWERDVYIWRLEKPVDEMMDTVETESDLASNRKLLAKVLVKGEFNITAASISEDGTLLVVSTSSEIKAFQLDIQTSEAGQFKITKLKSVPANRGATQLLISPNKKWLAWVEQGSNLLVSEIVVQDSESDKHTFGHPSRLRRLRREIPKHIALGGLGAYDRNITQLTFSSDSKFLAVADLAGYIDSWLLRGLDGGQNATATIDEDAYSSGPSSESSDEDKPARSASPWVRNPKGRLIPKLSAAPVTLSFSNDVPGWSIHNGDNGIEDYTLLVVTTSMQVLVFNPMRGAFSDWSRRNPYGKLPDEFRKHRDLVKGVVWQGQRAWIYSASSLFMLDLSLDLSPENGSTLVVHNGKQGTKRKRDGPDSGAGSKIDKHALTLQHVRMAVGPEKNEWVDVDMADADADDQKSVGASSAFDDEDEDMDGGELQALRNGDAANGQEAEQKQARTRWWHTYKYRPILGIVPLGITQSAGVSEGTSQNGTVAAVAAPPPLDVALVERPIWDVDLTPRYMGKGESER